MPSQREGILDSCTMGDDMERDAFAWKSGSAGLPMKRNLRWLKVLLWPKKSNPGSKPPRPTAYLDGLRGFAAFLVYWHHHELWPHMWETSGNEILESSFGYKGRFHLATFHGIRNLFTGGHIAVAIFYVLSGYVLSLKPLSLIQSGEYAQLADNLGSALFRRWFRLYIPLMVTTLVFVTSWHLFGVWNSSCEPKPTYGEELWNWYVEFKNFSFIFKEGWPWLTFNGHLWSIPLEMRGSIIIFTALLAFARATTKARLWCEVGLIVYFLYIADGYYGAYFVAGMLQCDLDLLAKRSDGELPAFLRRLEPLKTFIYYHFLLIGLFLAGVPSFKEDVEVLRSNPGWYWLSYLKPQAMLDPKWFYLFFGANFIVSAVPRLPWLRRFFEGRFCQYLGRIAFSLYMVHGPVLTTLGDRLYHAVGWVRPFPRDKEMLAAWINIFPLPKTGPLGLEIAFLVPHIILFPVTFWLADLVTWTVDEPSVRIAAWLYKKTLRGSPPPPPPPKLEDSARLA